MTAVALLGWLAGALAAVFVATFGVVLILSVCSRINREKDRDD